MEYLFLDDCGWDERVGPKKDKLNRIYRNRLADPEMNPIYKKMDVLSSLGSHIVELN